MVKQAAHHEGHEFARHGRFGIKVHSQVWVFPVSCDTQAFELFLLGLHPAARVVTTRLAEFENWNIVFVQAFGTELLFHLPFDRQAVAVPTGAKACVIAGHALRADDHVFEDLVEGVPHVQVAIRIWRAIMEDELIGAPLRRAQWAMDKLRIRQLCVPQLEQLRLFLGGAGPKWELCIR